MSNGHSQAVLTYSGIEDRTTSAPEKTKLTQKEQNEIDQLEKQFSNEPSVNGEHDKVKLSTKEQEAIDGLEKQFQDKPAQKHSKFTKFIIDLAYTMNHALVCTATDPLTDVPINQMVTKQILGNKGVDWKELKKDLKPSNIGAEIKESFYTGPKEIGAWSINHAKKAFGSNSVESSDLNLGDSGLSAARFYLTEIAGDFGAVPLTVAIRHYAPFVSKAIHKVADPIARPIFMKRAEKAALKDIMRFTHAGNIDEVKQSEEFQQRKQEIFDREFDNYPNGILWTFASPAINIGLQFALDNVKINGKTPLRDPERINSKTGKEHSLTRVLGARVLGKTIGAVTTSTLTFGLRAAAPTKMQKWDNWMERVGGKVVSKIGKPFGVDEDTIREGMDELKAQDPEHASEHHGKEKRQEHGKWSRTANEEAALSPSLQR